MKNIFLLLIIGIHAGCGYDESEQTTDSTRQNMAIAVPLGEAALTNELIPTEYPYESPMVSPSEIPDDVCAYGQNLDISTSECVSIDDLPVQEVTNGGVLAAILAAVVGIDPKIEFDVNHIEDIGETQVTEVRFPAKNTSAFTYGNETETGRWQLEAYGFGKDAKNTNLVLMHGIQDVSHYIRPNDLPDCSINWMLSCTAVNPINPGMPTNAEQLASITGRPTIGLSSERFSSLLYLEVEGDNLSPGIAIGANTARGIYPRPQDPLDGWALYVPREDGTTIERPLTKRQMQGVVGKNNTLRPMTINMGGEGDLIPMGGRGKAQSLWGNESLDLPKSAGRASLLPGLIGLGSIVLMDLEYAELIADPELRAEFERYNPVAQGRKHINDTYIQPVSDLIINARDAEMRRVQNWADGLESFDDQDPSLFTRINYLSQTGDWPEKPENLVPPIPKAPAID